MQKSGENIDRAELVAVCGTLVKVQALECGKRRWILFGGLVAIVIFIMLVR